MTWLGLALGSLLTLGGADLAQTQRCLGAHQCREANPVFAPLADHPAAFGAAKMGVDSALVFGLWKARTQHPKVVWVVTGVGLVARGWVVRHNAHEMQGR